MLFPSSTVNIVIRFENCLIVIIAISLLILKLMLSTSHCHNTASFSSTVLSLQQAFFLTLLGLSEAIKVVLNIIAVYFLFPIVSYICQHFVTASFVVLAITDVT